jgi:hypothetical protein
MEVIYKNGDTTVIASPDLSGRSNPLEGPGMTGKIVSGFICLIIQGLQG